jgi:hypothetical protein
VGRRGNTHDCALWVRILLLEDNLGFLEGIYIYKMLAYQHVKITTEIKNRHSTFVKSNITVEPPIRDPPRFPAKDT